MQPFPHQTHSSRSLSSLVVSNLLLFAYITRSLPLTPLSFQKKREGLEGRPVLHDEVKKEGFTDLRLQKIIEGQVSFTFTPCNPLFLESSMWPWLTHPSLEPFSYIFTLNKNIKVEVRGCHPLLCPLKKKMWCRLRLLFLMSYSSDLMTSNASVAFLSPTFTCHLLCRSWHQRITL
jgi:hypothetical protein